MFLIGIMRNLRRFREKNLRAYGPDGPWFPGQDLRRMSGRKEFLLRAAKVLNLHQRRLEDPVNQKVLLIQSNLQLKQRSKLFLIMKNLKKPVSL